MPRARGCGDRSWLHRPRKTPRRHERTLAGAEMGENVSPGGQRHRSPAVSYSRWRRGAAVLRVTHDYGSLRETKLLLDTPHGERFAMTAVRPGGHCIRWLV